MAHLLIGFRLTTTFAAARNARSDPRPGLPRRDLLPPDALPRPERTGLGRDHRFPDDVSRGAAEASRGCSSRLAAWKARIARIRPVLDARHRRYGDPRDHRGIG